MRKHLLSSRTLASIDLAASVLSISAALWLLHLSTVAVEETIQKYGRNIDSGGLEYVIATFYLMPSAALFGVAAVTMWRSWPLRRFAQGIALLWLVLPIMLVLISAVVRLR
jgi:hypothetical protein